MERRTQGNATFPLHVQRLIDGGIRAGRLQGKLEAFREGERKGKRDVLLRLFKRAGMTLTEDDRARIRACTSLATLDRWVDNVLEAKTVDEVFR